MDITVIRFLEHPVFLKLILVIIRNFLVIIIMDKFLRPFGSKRQSRAMDITVIRFFKTSYS